VIATSTSFYEREGTSLVHQLTAWSKDLRVIADGEGVVAMAGAVALRMLADRSGLTEALSHTLARPGFFPVHDRGRVLTDVAVAVACGARDIVDIEALRAQEQVFGPVASDTTALRALHEIGGRRPGKIAKVRAAARAHVWAQLPDGPPPATIAGGFSLGRTVVLRIDGSIVIAHSRKQGATGTYKRSFGHHPLGCWIDNTTELASLLLRPGNANANTAADLIAVVADAITQVPRPWRAALLVTSDTAGASHDFINYLSNQNHAAGRWVEYSVGFDVDAPVRDAIGKLPRRCWVPALDNTDGSVRDDMDVAELTGLLRERLDRLGWPANMRVIARRRKLAPGEQPTLFALDGYKFNVFVTNTTGLSLQLLDARHRAHARVEDRVRTTKDTGLGHLPSHAWSVNLAWCTAVSIAVDLLAWLKLLGLPTDLADCEPRTLRYRVLHVPARLTRGQRRRKLRLPKAWPWSNALQTAITRIRALPMPRPAPG
jgi:hypothetical protein